ncbi:BrnT family toxin [Brevundimonas sp. SL130]|uniref:BrnT family toxin n=1 Tax=Brevundimonas sp. SL130 TaxID=2995143 RepID=UPI00226CCAE9|nr:BrnT family toxin [Brevundimonas sp. SL130]WAC60841.1 BrnT family toxin [Brevundimonas sp. SL130]
MIVFDPAKDEANIAKHGVSLLRADEIQMQDALIEVDDRFDYGEPRWIAYGELDGRLHVLAFTVRDARVRAISLRRANDRELRYVREQRGVGSGL